MHADTSDDGMCPRCGQLLPTVRYRYGADADGNRGVQMDELDDCANCGWSEGEDVYKCDDCGEVVETGELHDTVDGEFCLECYFGQMEAIKKIATSAAN